MSFFARPWLPKRLYRSGILGMNRRNHVYIAGYNKRSLFPLVDNKLHSKKMASSAGVAVPKLLHVVHSQHGIQQALAVFEKLDQFVIKPAKGSGGKGIMVVVERTASGWNKSGGQGIERLDIERHISNILGGLYSLGGSTDVAVIEQLVNADPVFNDYSISGVPDIRTIVFQGYPVMSMVRLATAASDGKANLHQGAVGVGLDLAQGTPLRAVQFDRPVLSHPDTGLSFKQLQVPYWREILELSSACFEMSGLGYLGADIVLDRDRGPQLLELNARPGLAIQLANGQGLLPRLKKIEALTARHDSPAARVDYVQEHFGSQ